MVKKIESIKIKMDVDTDPDTSWLGEYSDTPGPGAIDREEKGDMNRGEYRYFTPGNYDPSDPDRDKYALGAYKRMESLNRGDFCFVGICAECDYLIKVDKTSWIHQDISSGGLWGIESDSGSDYLLEIANEELASLEIYLKEIGFTEKEIKPHIEKAREDFIKRY